VSQIVAASAAEIQPKSDEHMQDRDDAGKLGEKGSKQDE
jgi:hypothetical protein